MALSVVKAWAAWAALAAWADPAEMLSPPCGSVLPQTCQPQRSPVWTRSCLACSQGLLQVWLQWPHRSRVFFGRFFGARRRNPSVCTRHRTSGSNAVSHPCGSSRAPAASWTSARSCRNSCSGTDEAWASCRCGSHTPSAHAGWRCSSRKTSLGRPNTRTASRRCGRIRASWRGCGL